MDHTIGERIKIIREQEGLTQEKFGNVIGSARNTIANYENGNRTPSNAIINSICKAFLINENWLRTGREPMKQPVEDKLSSYLGQIAREDDFLIKDLVIAYMELDAESKEALRKIALNILKNKQKEEE